MYLEWQLLGIIAGLIGLGFVAGYGVRALQSRRRRAMPWATWFSASRRTS